MSHHHDQQTDWLMTSVITDDGVEDRHLNA